MFIWRFWGVVGRDVLDEVPSAEQTRRFLARERMRSDRTGCCMSVLAFHAADDGDPREMFRSLIEILQKRLRITDEVGWLDDRRLCAILPATPAEGALIVARDVCESFAPDTVPPICKVYSYPTDNLPESGSFRERERESEPFREHSVAPLAYLMSRPLPAWKRVLDIVGSLIALILLAPIMLLVALMIRLTSSGPVLFTQRRAGRGGRPFTLYKFRTMVVDAEQQKAKLRAHSEQDGPAFKMKHDPRVTRIGGFLRKTSLDELPQLWNVFRGDMSLVGPRPLPCDESEASQDWHRHRLDATPGITCIWQVHGRSRVTFNEWMRMDMRYIRSQSFIQDLKLLVLTIPAVIWRRGAH